MVRSPVVRVVTAVPDVARLNDAVGGIAWDRHDLFGVCASVGLVSLVAPSTAISLHGIRMPHQPSHARAGWSSPLHQGLLPALHHWPG